jgi:Ca2+-binding EF-hand superfamily protein
MKKVTIGLSLAALAIGGIALAEQASSPVSGGPMQGNATVTRAQMQSHAAEMFDRIDINRDGKIDPADREARRAAMFDRIDTDHNGQISRAEFTVGRPMRGGPDGQMRGEGHSMPGMGGKHGRGHGRGMGRMLMRTADANKDGAVTRDEFTVASAQHFDQMDSNKDGQVTPEERRASRQSMRQRMHDHKGHGMGGPGAPAPQDN